MRPVKSLVAGIVVGLLARDLSWTSAALLTLLFAVVLYLWDFLRLLAKEEVWVSMNTDRERLIGIGRMFGKLGLFSIVLDATIIALVGALTSWAAYQLRGRP